MKKLLKYLKDYKKETIIAPLFKLLEASFELLVPLVIAAMIDQGIKGNQTHILWQKGAVLFGFAIIGLICAVIAQYYAAKAAVGFATKLREDLFSHIESLSFLQMDELGNSTLITRMTSDVNQLQSGVNMVLRLFLRSPFIVFGAMIMAFVVDVKAAIIFVVVIPMLSVVVFSIMLISIPLYKKVQKGLDQILSRTRENLTGARVLRAFRMEDEQVELFERENEALNDMQRFVGRISSLMNPITFIIVNIATVLLIWVGGLRVDIGALSQGEVIALVNYMSQILVELIKLANLILLVNKATACADRVVEVLELENSMKSGDCLWDEKTEEVMVSFSKVCLAYNQGEDVLSDISFEAKKGEIIGIIGGTGSGKSSLVHLIPRFYDATKGEIKIAGQEIDKYRISSLRENIGMVMQKSVLFKGTIRDNLLWGNENATDEQLWRALEIAQAKEVVEGKSGQLSAEVKQEGRNLSGGQKQRLAIARAVVREPKILILDDSASALDFATDAKLRQAIVQNLKEQTVFIVSQRTSSIEFADRILVLEDGCLVGNGKHEDLLENCEVYKEIYESQFRKENKANANT